MCQINSRAFVRPITVVRRPNLAVCDQTAVCAIDKPSSRIRSSCVPHNTVTEPPSEHGDTGSSVNCESSDDREVIGNPNALSALVAIDNCLARPVCTLHDDGLGNGDLIRQTVFTFCDQNGVAIARGIYGLLNPERGRFPCGIGRRWIRAGLGHIQRRRIELVSTCYQNGEYRYEREALDFHFSSSLKLWV